MKITWNTDVNAPCCPGEIVAEDGRSLLIDTDWDYPSVAQTFGWSLDEVQACRVCGLILSGSVDSERCECDNPKRRGCAHISTDGTVDCRYCTVGRGDFIAAAYDWLRDNDGVEVDDPGYFGEIEPVPVEPIPPWQPLRVRRRILNIKELPDE